MFATTISELYDAIETPGGLTRKLRLEAAFAELVAGGTFEPASERGTITIFTTAPTVPSPAARLAVRP